MAPTNAPRFTFGLWTVGNPGRDPFGGPTREPIDPVDSVKKLGELGAWGVSLHDEDLIPWGTPAAERDQIVARFKAALDEAGLGVGMGTTNLFGHAAFKDGAFTSNDRKVRRAAIGKSNARRIAGGHSRKIVLRLDRNVRRNLVDAMREADVRNLRATLVLKMRTADGTKTIRRAVTLRR